MDKNTEYEEEEGKPHKLAPPDGGYGWVVVAATVLLGMLNGGHAAMYSILLPEYVEYFQVSKAQASVISAIGMSTHGLLGVFHGKLVEYFGCRRVGFVSGLLLGLSLVASSFAPHIIVLYFTHGLIPGIFSGNFHILSWVIVAEYFDKRKGFALSVSVTGTGLGLMVYGRFGQFLVTTFGWRGSLLLVGGIHLHCCVLAMLFRPYSKVNKRKKLDCSPKNMFDISLLKDPKYVIYIFFFCLVTAGHMMPIIFLPARAQSLGISKASAGMLISIYGIVSVVLRPVFGKLVDRLFRFRTAVMAASVCLVGVVTTVSYIFTTHLQLAIYFTIFAVFSSCYIGIQPTVLSDLLPADKLAVGSGLCFTMSGISQLIATPLSGWLVDITGTYSTPFLVFGIVQISGGILCFIVHILQWKEKKNNKHNEEVIDVSKHKIQQNHISLDSLNI